MANTRFSSARLKLRRAHDHLGYAQEIIRGFVANNFNTISVEMDRQGRYVIKLAALPKPPVQAILAIGDAAHCLRATLDHIAFECAIKPLTSQEEKQIEFPICSTGANWKSSKRRLVKLPKAAVTLIDSFQPYHRKKSRGSKLLSIVQAVNNWDKHRRISLTANRLKRLKFECVPPELLVRVRTHVGELKVGTVLARYTLAEGATSNDVQVRTKMVIVPFYSAGMPKEAVGESAVNSLVEAHNFIADEILPAFSAIP